MILLIIKEQKWDEYKYYKYTNYYYIHIFAYYIFKNLLIKFSYCEGRGSDLGLSTFLRVRMGAVCRNRWVQPVAWQSRCDFNMKTISCKTPMEVIVRNVNCTLLADLGL